MNEWIARQGGARRSSAGHRDHERMIDGFRLALGMGEWDRDRDLLGDAAFRGDVIGSSSSSSFFTAVALGMCLVLVLHDAWQAARRQGLTEKWCDMLLQNVSSCMHFSGLSDGLLVLV